MLTFVLDGVPVHKATEATCQNVNTEIGRNKGRLSRPTSVKSVQSVEVLNIKTRAISNAIQIKKQGEMETR